VATAGIDLLVPGLFGPVPIAPADLPRFLSLEQILARSDRMPAIGSDPMGSLLGRFDVRAPAGGDLPTAAIARLADDPAADPAGYWLHADPVHLRADRDQLLLFDGRHLAITPAEADALIGLFNAQFAGDGLRLEAPVPDRWYLHAETPPEIRTRPVHLAVGRHIGPLVPEGPGARRWGQVLNEVQMLFHGAEVNRARAADGRPTINGVWTWGGGRLPAVALPGELGAVCADHPVALGLARAAGLPAHPLARLDAVLTARGGDLLVLWDALWGPVLDAEPAAWVEATRDLDQRAADLLPALRQGRIGRLTLDPGAGARYRLTRSGLWRLWRRPAPMARRMLSPGGG